MHSMSVSLPLSVPKKPLMNCLSILSQSMSLILNHMSVPFRPKSLILNCLPVQFQSVSLLMNYLPAPLSPGKILMNFVFPASVLENVYALSVSCVSVFPRSQSLLWWASAPSWRSSALPWWAPAPSAPPWMSSAPP